MAKKSNTKPVAGLSRRKKHRAYGEPLPNAHHVSIPVEQSIKAFLASLGPDCVAYERYADGTLYFAGTVAPETCERLDIVAKPGWKPEIRRSRTLSLLVKAVTGGSTPTLTIAEAVAIVRQSVLGDVVHCIELVRVANTNKSNHIFVQFEGEIMARRHINKVDAMEYNHAESGCVCVVHGSQLNKYFEYEPEHEDVCDPLIWHNPEFIGKRTVTLQLGTQPLGDAEVIEAVSGSLNQKLLNSVESLRRVDMDATGVHAVVELNSEESAHHAFQLLRSGADAHTLRGVTGISMLESRRYDSESRDCTLWKRAGDLPEETKVATFVSLRQENAQLGCKAGDAGSQPTSPVNGCATPRSASDVCSFNSAALSDHTIEADLTPIDWREETTVSGYEAEMFQFFFQ